MFRFEIKGLDGVLMKLQRLKSNAQKLEGHHEIPVDDLFTPAFMGRNTKVASFGALVEAGGHRVESPADFRAIPDDAWERTVRAHTSFSSWREMQSAAAREYFAARLRS